MKFASMWNSRWRSLFVGAYRAEADQGAAPVRQRHAAQRKCRDTRKLAYLEGSAQDLRQGVRTLRRSPGFTVVSVLTLALGIGATSGMYSVIDRAILHPVNAPDPANLVWLQESSKAHSESGSNPARLADWRRANSFSAVAGVYSEGLVWRSAAGPVRLSVLEFAVTCLACCNRSCSWAVPVHRRGDERRRPASCHYYRRSFSAKVPVKLCHSATDPSSRRYAVSSDWRLGR